MAVSRIEALIAAARDVRPEEAREAVSLAEATRVHRERFDRYVRELRRAKRASDEWWKGLIEVETERIGDERQAAINVRLRRRPGPVIDPNVIHTIRSAWLDCQAINDQSAERDRVAPAVFVLQWLHQARRDELAEFVATLPFWPMGLDKSGDWI